MTYKEGTNVQPTAVRVQRGVWIRQDNRRRDSTSSRAAGPALRTDPREQGGESAQHSPQDAHSGAGTGQGAPQAVKPWFCVLELSSAVSPGPGPCPPRGFRILGALGALGTALLAATPPASVGLGSQALRMSRPIVLLADRSPVTRPTCLVTSSSESPFCAAMGRESSPGRRWQTLPEPRPGPAVSWEGKEQSTGVEPAQPRA